jgi:membrane protein YdbS with pleckstrin-like domain
MAEGIRDYLASKIKKIRENPELIAPYFISMIGVAISVIQYFLHELNTISIYASLIIIAIGLILYQILNCNVRVYEILSDIEYQKKIKSLWVSGKIDDKTFETKMTLLKRYPTNSKSTEPKSNEVK